VTTRRSNDDALHPVREPETEEELRAFLDMIRRADYSGPAPRMPKVLRRGEDPAVDRMIEKLRAMKEARGNVTRTAGEDAAAGYVGPTAVRHAPLPAVDTERRVKVSEAGVSVTVKEAPPAAAKEERTGPRNFAREKGEIFARLLEYPEDLPGTMAQQVFVNPEAQLALMMLEEEERTVVGDGPLSVPELVAAAPVPKAAPAKEVAWERHRQEQEEQAREREEEGEPAPGSLSPMVTPRGTAVQKGGAKRTIAVLALGTMMAGVLLWKVVATSSEPGQATLAAGEAEPAKTNPSPAATEEGSGKANPPASEVAADAGMAVKPDVKEPEEKKEPAAPRVVAHKPSAAPSPAPVAGTVGGVTTAALPAQKQSTVDPSRESTESDKEPMPVPPPAPTTPQKPQRREPFSLPDDQ
jgi:hypothetical protein